MIEKVLSIILGFIAVFIVKIMFFASETHGPDSNTIKKSLFKNGDRCYKYDPVAYICPL